MESRITSGIRFLATDGLSEALTAPRNCEPNGTTCGHFLGEGSRALRSPKRSFMQKGVKGSSAHPKRSASGLYFSLLLTLHDSQFTCQHKI